MNNSVFTGCLVAEELGYGCTGIATALEATGLGVSFCQLAIHLSLNFHLTHFAQFYFYSVSFHTIFQLT